VTALAEVTCAKCGKPFTCAADYLGRTEESCFWCWLADLCKGSQK
jgi:hypothetical protein